MKSNPKVGIIIPCLNAVSSIDLCIASALGQSYESIHVHVQDGVSTDGTLQKLQRFVSDKFTYTSEKDNGVYDAINRGIKQVEADWYYILGSDDKITGLDVVASVMALSQSEHLLLYGDIRYGRRSNKLIPKVHRSQFDRGLWWRNTLHQQGTFYHSSLILPKGFDLQFKILSDYALHLDLLKQEVSAKHIGMTICECSADGLSKQFNRGLYLEELRLKKQHLPFPLYLINWPWVVSKWVLKKFG